MIDPYMLRQTAEAKAAIDRLAPELRRVQEYAEESARFASKVEELLMRVPSRFETLVLQDRADSYLPRQKAEDQAWTKREIAEERAWVNEKLVLQDRADTYLLRHKREDQARIERESAEWFIRNEKDHMLISSVLPKRGWYLSGQEPCTLTNRLANAVNQAQWDNVDQQMMEHLPEFEVEPLREWLGQEGVPEHCITRLSRFLRHHGEGNFEESTYLGVPLLDEIAKHLYGGKTFTTKRASRRGGNQSKPELAIKTTSGPDLEGYCESFVQTFGSLQEDPDRRSLADENYWNRHAIVHGMMERAMGAKDSAKCLMAIEFLIFARKEKTDSGDTTQ
jgi:hypothetical protein